MSSQTRFIESQGLSSIRLSEVLKSPLILISNKLHYLHQIRNNIFVGKQKSIEFIIHKNMLGRETPLGGAGGSAWKFLRDYLPANNSILEYFIRRYHVLRVLRVARTV